jgi:hypothetical protein
MPVTKGVVRHARITAAVTGIAVPTQGSRATSDQATQDSRLERGHGVVSGVSFSVA